MIAYTHLEDYVNKLYKALSIFTPHDLDMDYIANQLRAQVYYGQSNFRLDNKIVIEKSTPQKEWQSFGHEIAHFLRHLGNQLSMHYLFIELQEYQANHFSYHFCVPTFMLEQIKGVTIYDVMELFNVDFDFAYTRLEMYKNKMISWRESYGTR